MADLWSRRKVLRLGAGLAMTSFLAACGAPIASPTPSAQKSSSRSVYLVPGREFTIGDDPVIRELNFYSEANRDEILAAYPKTSSYYLYNGKTDTLGIHASLLVGKQISLDFNAVKMDPVKPSAEVGLIIANTVFSSFRLSVSNPDVPDDKMNITLNSSADTMPLNKIAILGDSREIIQNLQFTLPNIMEMPEIAAAMAQRYESLPDYVTEDGNTVANSVKLELGFMRTAYAEKNTAAFMDKLTESYDNAPHIKKVVNAKLQEIANQLTAFAQAEQKKVNEGKGQSLGYAFPALTGPQINRLLDCTVMGAEQCAGRQTAR